GSRRSGYPKGVFAGGRKAGARTRWRGVWRRTNCKSCWRRATRALRKRRRRGGRSASRAEKKWGWGLAFLFRLCYARGHGRRVSLSGSGDHGGGSGVHPAIHCPASRHQPAAAFAAIMRSVGVEAGQWRSPRYGLPGTPLATAAGGAPGVAARAASASQPLGPARHARGESPDSASARYHAPGSAPAGAPALGVSASAAHARGAALQLPGRPVSSARLHAAGWGTPQISGLGGGPGDCLPGLVVGAAASGRPRSLYRLVGGGAAPQYPFSRLQSSLSHFALGPRPAFGVARSGSDGAQNRGRLGTDLRAPHLFSRDLRGSRTLSRHLLSCGQLGGDGADDGARQELPQQATEPVDQGSAGVCAHAALSEVAGGGLG